MKRYKAIYQSTVHERIRTFKEILADDDLTLDDVTARYERETGDRIGQANRYGGRLEAIQLIEEGVRLQIEPTPTYY